MAIKIGDIGPDFILKDNRNNEVNLSNLRGKRVLLSWHPLAWTGVCAEQMKSLEENRETLISLNTVSLGISIDSVPSKNAWGKELKITETPLVSDFWPHGGVTKLYGIFREKEGFSERANIILDEKGVTLWVKVYDIPQLPDMDEVIRFLAQ